MSVGLQGGIQSEQTEGSREVMPAIWTLRSRSNFVTCQASAKIKHWKSVYLLR